MFEFKYFNKGWFYKIKARKANLYNLNSKTRFYGVTTMYKSLFDNVDQLKSFIIKEGVTIDSTIQETIADFRKELWSSLKFNHILLNKIANLIGLFESYEATLGDVVHHLNNSRLVLFKELQSFGLSTDSKNKFTAFLIIDLIQW